MGKVSNKLPPYANYFDTICFLRFQHTKAEFDEKLHRFGTLTLVYKMEMEKDNKKTTSKKNKKTKTEKSVEQTVFGAYKQRGEIETLFDSYKNYLDADVSYCHVNFEMTE